MSEKFENTVAQSLEVSKDMLSLLPGLLKGVWDLGSSINNAVELFSIANLGSDSKVLDLGCGKGAVLITLAEKFGFSGVGIDGMSAFIDEAKHITVQKGLSDLLKFRQGDIFKVVDFYTDFDLLIFASIGPLFGNYKKTIQNLRKTIRNGGYIIFDDGFLKEAKLKEKKGYEEYLTDEEIVNELISFGDTIVKEVIVPSEEMIAMNERYIKIIENNSIELKSRFRNRSLEIEEYVENQKEECEFLNTSFTCATWLIQKSE